MLLKKLELHGLKSFADKTTLDLSGNITAIVGPNGSGKSNITDGVRWLLGERDARNLRGEKGEDLIFAGNKKRPRMGLAQATLYFDNSSGFFPIDFTEISISRRISRDGNSQFFINKSEVRLKELIDFLARVKLGAKGLTIINQGESDVFIKASPQERREMIEEMLGLKEYQLKKSDATRKLQNTFANLDKVKAMIDELVPHIRLLRRQSLRYQNREKIADELLDIENSFYGNRLFKLRKELDHIKRMEVLTEEQVQSEGVTFKKFEAKVRNVSKSQPEAAGQLREIQKTRGVITKRRAELGHKLGRVETELEFQSREVVRDGVDFKKILKEIRSVISGVIDSDINALKDGLKRVIFLIEEAFESVPEGVQKENGPDKEYKKLVGDIEELDKELALLDEKEGQYQKILEEFNKKFSGAYRELELERKNFEELTIKKNKITIDKERVCVQMGSLKEELMQVGRDIESLERVFVKTESYDASINTDDGVVINKMFKLRGELLRIGEIDENILADTKKTEERYGFLEGQVSDLTKASEDLARLIKELDEKIYTEFHDAIEKISKEFGALIEDIFGGGKARLIVKSFPTNGDDWENEVTRNKTDDLGIKIDISLPGKRVKGLDLLSGGERSLVSIAALFALISVSPPPFLILDEIDASLDEENARRFGKILKKFSTKTQFVIVTHNRATMEAAQVLYGCTMTDGGASKLISLKLG